MRRPEQGAFRAPAWALRDALRQPATNILKESLPMKLKALTAAIVLALSGAALAQSSGGGTSASGGAGMSSGASVGAPTAGSVSGSASTDTSATTGVGTGIDITKCRDLIGAERENCLRDSRAGAGVGATTGSSVGGAITTPTTPTTPMTPTTPSATGSSSVGGSTGTGTR
jgi:hypothetical protein